MSAASSCLLCLNICDVYKSLYDADGVCDMELYNITVKYFNTKFITEASKNQTPVVCFKCWQCMSLFNSFQKFIIMTHEQFSKDSLKQYPEKYDGIPRAKRNESPSELQQLDEESIDSLQLSRVGGQQKDGRNKSPAELGIMDEGSFKMEITTKPICISSVETTRTAHNTIDPSIYAEEEPPEILSSDENSQSANMNDIDSDSEGCQEIPETANLLSGEKSDINSLSQQSILSNQEQHSSTEVEVSQYTNWICPKGRRIYKSSEELDEIILKWKSNLECAICKAVVPNFPLLRSHTNQKHPQMNCQIFCCQRLHMGASLIAQHATFHMDPQCFKCHICSRTFTSKVNLYSHRRRAHPVQNAISIGAPRYKCRICGKTILTKRELEDHEAHHMGIKLYKCLLCSKAFTFCGGINRHLKTTHPTEWSSTKGSSKNRCYTKVNLDDVSKGQVKLTTNVD